MHTWHGVEKTSYGTEQSPINLYQTTTSNMPTHGTRTHNGLYVMDFDGDDRMTTTDSVTDPSTHHFIALVATSAMK